MISVAPETAPWTLTDNSQITIEGSGCAMRSSIPPGQLRITWKPLGGYKTPSPNLTTATLTADGTVNFCMVYLPQTTGPAQTQARLVRYLLGLPESPSGIDLDSDGLINTSDLVRSINLLSPGLPLSPNPVNGATGVSTQPILDWTDSPHATHFDLYLWKSVQSRPPQPIAPKLSDSIWRSSTRLSTSTAYRWLVVARNGDLVTTGSTWSFTTTPASPGIPIN